VGHQHVLQQHLIAWFLRAQSCDEAKHEEFVVLAFFGVHVESMDAVEGDVCQARPMCL
jgi:hypothetical protein